MLSLHGELARARKPDVWAAAALHPAPLTLSPGYAKPDRPTKEDAARCFGVSAQSVSDRSGPLRPCWYGVLDGAEHPRFQGLWPGLARLARRLEVSRSLPCRGRPTRDLAELGELRVAGRSRPGPQAEELAV